MQRWKGEVSLMNALFVCGWKYSCSNYPSLLVINLLGGDVKMAVGSAMTPGPPAPEVSRCP